MFKEISKKMWRDIIERNLSTINLVVNKSYTNNSFFIDVVNERDVKNFEKQFAKNLANSINSYLEEKGEDPKKYSRSLTFSVNNKENHIVINF